MYAASVHGADHFGKRSIPDRAKIRISHPSLTCWYSLRRCADTNGMDGRNIEPRTVLWAIAEVCWKGPTGTPYRAPATLEDTSPSGAWIRLKSPSSIGSRLIVKWKREHFLRLPETVAAMAKISFSEFDAIKSRSKSNRPPRKLSGHLRRRRPNLPAVCRRFPRRAQLKSNALRQSRKPVGRNPPHRIRSWNLLRPPVFWPRQRIWAA
jgi:hypothetical protein